MSRAKRVLATLRTRFRLQSTLCPERNKLRLQGDFSPTLNQANPLPDNALQRAAQILFISEIDSCGF
jgi:hypothetical protein